MHIDAHQHFWIYKPEDYDWIDESMGLLRRDFLPGDLGPERQKAGFQGSIAVQARQSLEETSWLLELADGDPSIMGVVGWVDLCPTEAHSQLAAFARNPKLVGVRHIVQSEPDDHYLVRDDFLRGIALLEEFDLTYDILIYPRHLPVAAQFVQRFPKLRFVLDHLAKPHIKAGEIEPWATGIRALAKFPNVYCKLSGLVTEADWQSWKPEQITPYLDVAFDAFGPERLMIGSDWPVCLVAASYETALDVVKNYLLQFSSEIQDNVLGGNARRFWKLPR
ncbi:MAG: amidohydrolase family protein [Candidatus Sulfotelmatobacter sp.]